MAEMEVWFDSATCVGSLALGILCVAYSMLRKDVWRHRLVLSLFGLFLLSRAGVMGIRLASDFWPTEILHNLRFAAKFVSALIVIVSSVTFGLFFRRMLRVPTISQFLDQESSWLEAVEDHQGKIQKSREEAGAQASQHIEDTVRALNVAKKLEEVRALREEIRK